LTDVLQKAGASFLRAFGVAFLFFVTGILNAPNKDAAVSLSIAAFVGSLAAGLRAVQVFIPQLSWAGIMNQPFAAWADAFTRAFLATLLITLTGWLAAPEYDTWKSFAISAVVGALAAGARALQGLTTNGEEPAKGAGI
jgi:hypothetical protein